MVFEPSVFRVALATTGMVGTPFEDVSDKVLFDEGGFEYGWGRESQFRDTRPGEFSFTLDNSDGRFSPESSFYAVPLFEGMRVLWMLGGELVDEMLTPTDEITGLLSGGRVVEGRISSLRPLFADITNAETARMRVTVVDELAALSKISVASPISGALIAGCDPSVWVPFDDPVGSVLARNAVDGPSMELATGEATLTFGVDPRAAGEGTQCRVTLPGGGSDELQRQPFTVTFSDGFGTGASWSVWVTPNNATSVFEMSGLINNPGDGSRSAAVRLNGANFEYYNTSGAWATLASAVVGQTYNLSVTGEGAEIVFRVDGVELASNTVAGFPSLLFPTVSFPMGGAGDTDVTISGLTSTVRRPRFEDLSFADATTRLGVLSQIGGGDVFDTLPAGLSDSILDPQTGGGTLLDAVNDVIRAEQGYVYSVTGGTLTAPTSKVVVRERDRPATVTETFTTTTDLSGAPKLDRNIVDAASEVIVTSSGGQFVVRDASLLERLGTVSRSETVLLSEAFQAISWARDRIVRGEPVGLDVVSFTVDARGSDTDRWEDLLGLVPGDRITVAGFPSTQLGFTSKDAWLIGGRELHTSERNLFTFYLQPVIEGLGKYGTARYAADGALTLSAGINSSVTSMSVATSGPTFTTTDLPQTIIVDSEQMTVTAVTSATPQVFTVTRGVNGSTAASHSSGAEVEIKPTFEYGF